MKSRGQAALEFLSTYGFAFLIILVMIGALAYFGVLNPTRFLPERCLLGSEFECRDFAMIRNADDTVNASFLMVNNLGNTVGNFSGDAITNWGAGAADSCAFYSTTASGGATVLVSCNVPGIHPATGEKIKAELNLQYRELGGTFNHPIKGEIFATLQ